MAVKNLFMQGQSQNSQQSIYKPDFHNRIGHQPGNCRGNL